MNRRTDKQTKIVGQFVGTDKPTVCDLFIWLQSTRDIVISVSSDNPSQPLLLEK